jgi:hypothetical protein
MSYAYEIRLGSLKVRVWIDTDVCGNKLDDTDLGEMEYQFAKCMRLNQGRFREWILRKH